MPVWVHAPVWARAPVRAYMSVGVYVCIACLPVWLDVCLRTAVYVRICLRGGKCVRVFLRVSVLLRQCIHIRDSDAKKIKPFLNSLTAWQWSRSEVKLARQTNSKRSLGCSRACLAE